MQVGFCPSCTANLEVIFEVKNKKKWMQIDVHLRQLTSTHIHYFIGKLRLFAFENYNSISFIQCCLIIIIKIIMNSFPSAF